MLRLMLRLVEIHQAGSGDEQFPSGYFGIVVDVQVVRELHQPGSIGTAALLGSLPEIVGRDALIIDGGLHGCRAAWNLRERNLVAQDIAATSVLIGRIVAGSDRRNQFRKRSVWIAALGLKAVVLHLMIEAQKARGQQALGIGYQFFINLN